MELSCTVLPPAGARCLPGHLVLCPVRSYDNTPQGSAVFAVSTEVEKDQYQESVGATFLGASDPYYSWWASKHQAEHGHHEL
eukprot:6386314-Amphidinium_carterae.1